MEPFELRTHKPDAPVLIMKPSTETGTFEGVFGGVTWSGTELCIHGLSLDEATRAYNGDGEVLSDRLVAVAGGAGTYAVQGCEVSLMDMKKQWATRLDGDSIQELS